MKKIAFVFVSALILGAIGFWANGTFSSDPMAGVSDSPAMQYKKSYEAKNGEKKKKGILGAKEYLHLMRANQNTGIVSMTDVLAARSQWLASKQLKAQGGRSLGLTWEELGPDNVGGRTRAIVIDPANPERMWCGGVAGGLFFSVNGGLSWEIHPWTKENDHVGISTMRMAPNGDIYIGTGEGFAPVIDGVPTTFGAPGYIGSGLYRSTNDGATFDLIPATTPAANSNNDRWSFIYEIAFDPFDNGKFYVATHEGIMMTTDGGATFISPAGITPALQTGPALEVAVDPVLGHVYAQSGNHIFRSLDNGLTFTDITGLNGFPAQNKIGRLEFAVTKGQQGLVYACVSTPGFAGTMDGIYRSDDNGSTWTIVVRGSTNGFNPLGEQGFWGIAFAIDPANPNRLIIGGQLELWSVNVSGGRDLIAYWQPDIPSNPYYVHADMHVVLFHPTDPNIMYVGTDGGVSRSNNAQDQFPRFTPRNKGLGITQFYGFATGFDGTVIGGTQDNGTHYNDCKNNAPKTFREVNGGDGGDAAISRLYPNISFSTVYSGALSRSVNFTDSYSCALDDNIDANTDCAPDDGTLFLTPIALWEDDSLVTNTVYRTTTKIDKTTQAVISQVTTPESISVKKEKAFLFICTNNGIWFSPNPLNPSLNPVWFKISVSGTATAVTVSEQGVAFVGTQTGNVYRIDGLTDGYVLDSLLSAVNIAADPNDANIEIVDSVYDYFYVSPLDRSTWTFPSIASNIATSQGIRRVKLTVPGTTNRYVTGFAINPSDPNQVVVTYGQYGNTDYVFQTSNGNDPPVGQTTPLPTFQSIQNNLPQMPVYDAVFDYYNGNNLLLGTELGVWSTNNYLDGATQISWSTENAQDFGAVPTFQLNFDKLYDKECRVLYAATHGRGIFRTTSLTPSTCDVTPCKEIVGVNEVANSQPTSLKLYPNPVSAAATLDLYVKQGREAVVMVYDITGRVVYNQKLSSLVTGLNKVNLELSQLQSGSYIVAAQIPGEKLLTTKLIKQ